MARDFELSRSSRGPWSALTLAALSPALACGPPAFTSLEFTIVDVAYDGVDTLTLTFSEPIAELGPIDPNDFRISAAQSYHYIYSYAGQSYDEQGTLYADVGYGYGYARHTFASAALGAADNVLVLKMSAPLGTYVCEVIAYYDEYYSNYIEEQLPGSEFEMGMYLHYARRSIPLESAAGEALEDIGPQWVLEPGDYMVVPRFGFVNLDPKLEIPCG